MKQEILNYKLCYIEDNWAYFTSCELDHLWGDDWDGIPYEHNAGEPYDSHNVTIDGFTTVTDHAVIRVAWDGNVDPPCSGYTNSYWSVKQINNGDVAWLSNKNFIETNAIDNLYAGASLLDFIKFIQRNSGEVYYPLQQFDIETTVDSAENILKNKPVFRGEFG